MMNVSMLLYWADVEICVKKQWHERSAAAADSCVACEQLQKSARKGARHTQDGQ